MKNAQPATHDNLANRRNNWWSGPGRGRTAVAEVMRAIPICGIEIQRAEDEHVGIGELIDKVQSVRPSRMGSAEPRLAEQLGAAVARAYASYQTELYGAPA